MTSRIYVACLAAYNNGILHGRWIDASRDTEAMQQEVRAVLASSPVPDAEEWAIHDTEGLPNTIGEFSGLEAVASFMGLVEDYPGIDLYDLIDIVQEVDGPDEARELLEDRLIGVYDSFRDYADEFADEQLAALGQEDTLAARYFDYEAFARDLRVDLNVIDLKSGRVAIFHA